MHNARFNMAVGMCRCGTTFTRVPANKKHCSVTCARKHDKEKRVQKFHSEQQQLGMAAKVNWKPTAEQLRAAEATLVAMAQPVGQTFHGVTDGETLFVPADPTKIMWSESPGQPGVWNMVYVG